MFTFQFLNDKIDQNTNLAKLPSAKWLFMVCISVNFIIQKFKKVTLSLSQFSLVTGFFEGTREIILKIFRALDTF